MENHSVLLSYPLERSVSIVFPEDKRFNCTLKEAVVDDGTSGNPDAIATWNGYSNSGNATGGKIIEQMNYFHHRTIQLI